MGRFDLERPPRTPILDSRCTDKKDRNNGNGNFFLLSTIMSHRHQTQHPSKSTFCPLYLHQAEAGQTSMGAEMS